MYNEKKEIQELEFEKKIFETKNDMIHNKLVEDIINGGLGVEINSTLRNPMKINKLTLLKIKIQNFIKTLIDVL